MGFTPNTVKAARTYNNKQNEGSSGWEILREDKDSRSLAVDLTGLLPKKSHIPICPKSGRDESQMS